MFRSTTALLPEYLISLKQEKQSNHQEIFHRCVVFLTKSIPTDVRQGIFDTQEIQSTHPGLMLAAIAADAIMETTDPEFISAHRETLIPVFRLFEERGMDWVMLEFGREFLSRVIKQTLGEFWSHGRGHYYKLLNLPTGSLFKQRLQKCLQLFKQRDGTTLSHELTVSLYRYNQSYEIHADYYGFHYSMALIILEMPLLPEEFYQRFAKGYIEVRFGYPWKRKSSKDTTAQLPAIHQLLIRFPVFRQHYYSRGKAIGHGETGHLSDINGAKRLAILLAQAISSLSPYQDLAIRIADFLYPGTYPLNQLFSTLDAIKAQRRQQLAAKALDPPEGNPVVVVEPPAKRSRRRGKAA
jgi:hypothetical protein